MTMNKYYDENKYKVSNRLFDDFLNQCILEEPVEKEFGEFTISTITFYAQLCEEINMRRLFQHLDESDKDIEYIEYGKIVKGKREKKKPKKEKEEKPNKDKRKNGKNSPFSNQMSIGLLRDEPGLNSLCAKIFKNGKLHVTGAKSMVEIEQMYNKLYNKLTSINTTYILDNKPITINTVSNMNKYDSEKIRIEMVNGTFRINGHIDLVNLVNLIEEKYSHEEVFITKNNKKTPIICSLKMYSRFDENKQKHKIPSLFIHNSGSINISSSTIDTVYQSYEFIRNFLNDNYNDIIERKIIFDESFFENYQEYKEEIINETQTN